MCLFVMRIMSAKEDTGSARLARQYYLIDGVSLRGSKGRAGRESCQPSLTGVHQ
jgi:hypothetical protein